MLLFLKQQAAPVAAVHRILAFEPDLGCPFGHHSFVYLQNP
jgi:hypothetical protein